MTLFYDPLKKRPQMWIIAAFILVPIIIVVLLYVGSKGAVEKKKNEKIKEDTVDIFR
ncbi:MAG: hypothetical protein HQL26_09855 [Candidatus Omnitrophica bacterium]|nr:hypothetical protein [Candidatus Omnitrophota bacterium]